MDIEGYIEQVGDTFASWDRKFILLALSNNSY